MLQRAAAIALVALTTVAVASAAVTSATGSSAVAKHFEKCLPSISYSPDGSGAGATAAKSGEVGVSDVPIGLGGDSVECPLVSGSIGVIVNLPGSVKLDKCTLSGIFQGTITTWDDEAITALNPDAGLSGDITAVGRSDKSGSTNLFSQYVSGCSSWTLGVGKTVEWPASVKTASGTSGVLGAVSSTPGAITYASRGSPQALLKGSGGYFDATTGKAPIKFTAVVGAQKTVAGLKEFLEEVKASSDCAASAGLIPLDSGKLGELEACIDSL